MIKTLLCAVLSLYCTHPAPAAAGTYEDYEELAAVVAQLEKDGVYAPGELQTLFGDVSRQGQVLSAIAKPAEGKEWREYRPLFLTEERMQAGLAFWREHEATLARAEAEFGVPAEMILGILGVETKYGGNKGRIRVLDALATLAFDYPPRAPFFRKELREYLVLAKEQGLDPLSTYGSYAGAMGYPQFIPSSWRNLAIDYDGDGKRDLINNPVDAIGSIANYFQKNGWRAGDRVTFRARITSQDYDNAVSDELKVTKTIGELAQKGLESAEGDLPPDLPANAIRLYGARGNEFWLTFPNFYVITRYNRSKLYAMAAWQLALELKAAREAELTAAALPTS